MTTSNTTQSTIELRCRLPEGPEMFDVIEGLRYGNATRHRSRLARIHHSPSPNGDALLSDALFFRSN
jgi:hypothetical protein